MGKQEMDARAQKITLKAPCGGCKPRRVQTTTTATDVFDILCMRHMHIWRVIVRPMKASKNMVIRQVDWVERPVSE